MNTTFRLALASFVALLLLVESSPARAADSTHPGFYVEGSPLGVGTLTLACREVPPFGCIGGGVAGAYRISAEFGYHFTGRQDGFVLGVRQLFLFGSDSAGSTEARLGWDIAIPIKRFELTVAPYGVAGLAYGFNNQGVAFAFGFGAEGKFFFHENLYAFLIPLELGAWVGNGFSGFVYQAGAGIGYAF
jgi:hypothetical protein